MAAVMAELMGSVTLLAGCGRFADEPGGSVLSWRVQSQPARKY